MQSSLITNGMSLTPAERSASPERSAGVEGRLGILGEMSGDFKQIIDSQTGEILNLNVLTHDFSVVRHDDEQLRFKRFELLNQIGFLLGNDFRVSRCHKFPSGKVQIYYSSKFERAHFSGLVTCGSVWVCPICSAKITSKRASYLKDAIQLHRQHGGSVYMMTLTAPHSLDDSLAVSLSRWKIALTHFHSSHFYKSFFKICNIEGHVRSLEITYSLKSGWHVHCHYLLFSSNSNFDREVFINNILPVWQKSAVYAGFNKPNWRGLDLRFADHSAGDYVSKWGIHNEIVKSNFKDSRSETSFSPFELVSNSRVKPFLKPLFVEYAKSTTASKAGIKKGMNHLSFSRSLRSYFSNIGFSFTEKTDEDLVSEKNDKAFLLKDISDEDFFLLSKKNLLAAFLASAKNGADNANQFLLNIKGSTS